MKAATASASAFLRADLTGGYTDIHGLVPARGSTTVNIATSHRAVVVARRQPTPGCVVVRSKTGSAAGSSTTPGQPTGLEACWRAITAFLGIEADCVVTCDLPLGSGLGTSGAITQAMAAAAIALDGTTGVSPRATAELGALAERATGHLGGSQDQYGSLAPGVHILNYDQVGLVRHRTLPLPTLLQSATLCVDEAGNHGSSDLVAQVIRSAAKGDAAVGGALDLLADLGGEMSKVLDHDQPGRLIDLVWRVTAQQRHLDPAIAAAIDAHPLFQPPQSAYAAKPLGAGGPGASWLIIGDLPDAVRASVTRKGFSLVPILARTHHDNQ